MAKAKNKSIYSHLTPGQRYALRAARLRAEGKEVKRELVPDPQPDDLIRSDEVARMAGLSEYTLRWMRNNPGLHPVPPYYLKVHNTTIGNRWRYHWQRQQITDWVDERKAVQMAPVVLNWYEIYRLRQLLSNLPDFGDKRAREIREVLGQVLELDDE